MLCYHDCSWNTCGLCIIIILNEYHYYQSSCNVNQIYGVLSWNINTFQIKKTLKNIDKETHPAPKITHKTMFMVKEWWSRKQESFLTYLIPSDRFLALARTSVTFRKPGCMWCFNSLALIKVLVGFRVTHGSVF